MASIALAPSRLAIPSLSRTGLAVIGVAVLAVVSRLFSGWITPLGFDETFSAVIASQTTPTGMIDWCLHEIGGPVYYTILWCWAQVFGTSTAMLRAPSLLFSLATPLVILRWGHPDRTVRVYWAVLLALWLPALEPATNARCYALLMLETTGQAIVFRRLLANPTRRHAFAWTGLSALAVLTHYHAAVLAGVQGLIFVASRPRAAWVCWPALLPLVPMAGWMAVHLPLLMRFATQGAWYPILGLSDLLLAPTIFFGSVLIGNGALLAAVICLAQRRYRLREIDFPDMAVVLSGIAVLILLLAIGTLRSSFCWRYTLMLGPAVLLGIAVGIRQAGKAVAIIPTLVMVLFAASSCGRIVGQTINPQDEVRYALNLGWPSHWLVARHATRVGFLWDSPTGRISEPKRMEQVIGFGPRQAGATVQVSILPQPEGEQPDRIVEHAIEHGGIDGLIWLADATVPGTRAMPAPGVLLRHGWRCEDFGGARLSMLTCRAPVMPRK